MPKPESPVAASGEISQLAEHLFRHESGKLISILTGIFGTERLQLAEDVVQESLVRALQTWPYYGIPQNPAAWLTQTAKHLTLDLLRREQLFREKQPQIIATLEHWSDGSDAHGMSLLDHEITDERLRLMFACCHPHIPPDAQVALALRTLCGFSPAEIAKAFLTTEAAIAKRLTRARQRIRELRLPFEIPAGPELSARLDAVLQTLYLLFNEGYKASQGERLVKEELCHEAMRLTTLLASQPAGNQPRTHGLAALMSLNAARLPARVSPEGNLLLLKDQDRSRWDRTMIRRGLWHLSQSASGAELTVYQLQAGIAACHCLALDYRATDWDQILSLYDRLLQLDDGPVVALNRAVAVAQVHGPKAGLEAIAAIKQRRALESYYLLYSVMAEFEAQLGKFSTAASHVRTALRLTAIPSEQALLTTRLKEYESLSPGLPR